ncbi:MAG: radical SAM protein, partial [Nitrososphaerales archaeon]
MKKNEGYKIVLTADRTLMSEYNGGIFLGFSACVPKGLIPDWLYFSIFCPSVSVNEDGSVKYAPCGTRKIEAALLDNGFKREDVIVAHPDRLEKVIGPNTKVVGITENDPLGIGPATSTFTQLFGREAYMSIKFRELLNNPAIKKYKPKIVVGGAGAWQLEDKEIRERLGIDCVVIGEGEKVVISIFEKALNNESLPEVVYGEVIPENDIPLIREPTIDGIVEIARGCGRGCDFCVPTLQRYRCFPIDHILEEVEVNLRAGRNPLLHAEDVLRYKAKGLEVNKEAVINLFKEVKNYPGVNSVGISHFALSSVASAPDLIEEISNIVELGKNNLWLSGQTGIETGSPRLIKDHMIGKCKPFKPEDWPQVVVDAFEILSKNSWVPCATLILGLPGENEKDIDLT